jgi:hypothetical protein
MLVYYSNGIIDRVDAAANVGTRPSGEPNGLSAPARNLIIATSQPLPLNTPLLCLLCTIGTIKTWGYLVRGGDLLVQCRAIGSPCAQGGLLGLDHLLAVKGQKISTRVRPGGQYGAEAWAEAVADNTRAR